MKKTSLGIGMLLMMAVAASCGEGKIAEQPTENQAPPATTEAAATPEVTEETAAVTTLPETQAETEAADTLSGYSALLDWYYQQISTGWSQYDHEKGGYGPVAGSDPEAADDAVSYLWYSYDTKDLGHTGYQLLDIDHDGTDELIVGTIYEDRASLYDLYTLRDGKAVRLASSGERDIFEVGDGVIIESGSGGAALHMTTHYHLTDGKLEPFEEYKYDGDADPDEPLFYSNEPVPADWGGYEFVNYQHITEDEFNESGSYEILDLALQPFSDYTPSQSQ